MNGTLFGFELRKMRNKRRLTSKQLSQMIGKGDAYVSQLESGKIKNPDYNICCNLLSKLGVDDPQIDEMLYRFNILSPEREAEFKSNQHLVNEVFSFNEPNLRLDDFSFIDHWSKETTKIYNTYDRLNQKFKIFISRDFSTAQKAITNLDMLTCTMEDTSFVFMLNSCKYSKIRPERRDVLLEVINNFIASEEYEADKTAAQ